MSLSQLVKRELDEAIVFGERLESLVVEKKQVPAGERNALLLGYWALVFDFHKGILCLLRTGYYGSAFALVRPIVEAVLRAHIVLAGDDSDLKKLQEDDYRVDFKAVANKIDAAFGMQGLMQAFLNDDTRSALHSYTHSGVFQVGRRFDGYDLKPNYASEEIVEVIRVATSATFMLTNLVTKYFGFEDDWKNVTDMFAEWGKHGGSVENNSMNFENILLEKKNAIAYVTVNRPKVLNALNMATMEELRAAFHDIKNDRTIRVVIFTGAGEKAFIAGADISELAKQDAVTGKEYTHRGQSVLNLIENLGKPVIACINGFALGGGCEIAMACTMRLASDNAKLGQPEVKLGIIPGYGGSQRLPRLVGKGIAMQHVLTGEMITAQEAHRIGLVNEVTAPAELIPRAEAIAAKIIANAPLAVQYAMEAVNKGMEMTLAEGLYLEAVLFAVSCATEDKAEGTKAFLEKRAAQFKGK